MESNGSAPDWEATLLTTGHATVQKRTLVTSNSQYVVKRFRPWTGLETSRTGLSDITNQVKRPNTQPHSPLLKTKARADPLFVTLSTEQRTLTDIHARPKFRARKVPRSLYEYQGELQVRPKPEEKPVKAPLFVPAVPFRAIPLNPLIMAGATFAVQYDAKPTVPQAPALHTQVRADQRSASLNTSLCRPATPAVSLRDTLKQLLGKMEGLSQVEAMEVDQPE